MSFTRFFWTCTMHPDATTRRYEHRPYLWFLPLILPTVFAIFLLVGDTYKITTSNTNILNEYRASTQIVVQILSHVLGSIQVISISRLVNYATRIRMIKGVPLGYLSVWSSISLRYIRWTLPLPQLMVVILFVATCLVPSALWAGALSPVSSIKTISSSISIPDYQHNISQIHEYPFDGDYTSQALRTPQGVFTFWPAWSSAADLTTSMATATTANGELRQHAKLDFTKYTYNGRSYGVGAPVGLTDGFDSRALAYTYRESGYDVDTDCWYNSSTQYFLRSQPDTQDWVYNAYGYLPDTNFEDPELTAESNAYYGPGSSDEIVAIGVSDQFSANTVRYLAIASGSTYAFLNTTQCKMTFTPRLFEVNVDVLGRNITVNKLDEVGDFEPSGNLTHHVVRQLDWYAADLTNLYRSQVGVAINSSISDYRTYSGSPSVTLSTILGGLTNSVTAALDDILVMISSAQLMVQNSTTSVDVQAQINAVAFGERFYIVAIFVVNILVIILVVFEAIRTRLWRDLLTFDYTDPQSLIIASVEGPYDVVGLADGERYALVTSSNIQKTEDEWETELMERQPQYRYHDLDRTTGE